MPIPPGIAEANDALQAGFSPEEIAQGQEQDKQDALAAGFSSEEIQKYYEPKEPDFSDLKSFFKNNLLALKTPSNSTLEEDKAKSAKLLNEYSLVDTIDAAFQNSTTGLWVRGKKPDPVNDFELRRAVPIAEKLGMNLVDLPLYTVSYLPGFAAGGPIAGGATSLAIPAALRKKLMLEYERGTVKDPADFWDRTTLILSEAIKEGTLGAITVGAGKAVNIFGETLSPIIKTSAEIAAEVGTYTTLASAFEGHTPEWSEFTDGAIIVAAFRLGEATPKMVGHITKKLQNIYSETGVRPKEVIDEVTRYPAILDDILSTKEIPDFYDTAKKTELNLPVEITQPSNSLSSDFSAPEVVKIRDVADPLATPKKEPKPEAEQPERKIKIISYDNKKRLNISLSEIYDKIFNDLEPIRRITDLFTEGKKVPTIQDPESLMLLLRGGQGRSQYFLNISPYDFHTLKDKPGKPISEIIKPFSSNIREFEEYLIHRRNIEVLFNGFETPIPREESVAYLKENGARMEAAAKEFTQANNDALDFISEIVGKANIEKIKEKNQYYAPWNRAFSVFEENVFNKGRNVKNPIEEMVGSKNSDFYSPVETTIRNTVAAIHMAELNRALTALVDLSLKAPEDVRGLLKRVDDGQYKKPKIKDKLLTVQDQVEAMQELGLLPGPDGSTKNTEKLKPILSENTFRIFRDGVPETWQAPPEVITAIKATDAAIVHPLLKMLALPTKIKRAGTVLSPEYVIRNVVRDMPHAIAVTDGYTLKNWGEGLGKLFLETEVGAQLFGKKFSEDYRNWLKSGAANATIIELAAEYNVNGVNLLNFSKEHGLLDRTKGIIKAPIHTLESIGKYVEQGPRFGRYLQIAKGSQDPSKVFEGGLASRSLTFDSNRSGAWARNINLYNAFWNARMQVWDTTYKAFQERPVETFKKMLTIYGLSSAMFWYLSKDDPEYQNAPNWLKAMAWKIPGTGTYGWLPKGELGMVFGSPIEFLLDKYSKENKHAFDDFGKTLFSNFSADFLSDSLTPFFEAKYNKSEFTGSPLYPPELGEHGSKQVVASERFNYYTSDTAKQLGKLIGEIPFVGDTDAASPAIIENFIKSWGGALGSYALKIADEGLYAAGVVPKPIKPDYGLADTPVASAFFKRYPTKSLGPISRFREIYANNAEVINTVEKFKNEGRIEELEAYLQDPANQERLAKMKEVNDTLNKLSALHDKIYANPEMSKQEKTDLIQQLLFGMLEAAKVAVKEYDDFVDSKREYDKMLGRLKDLPAQQISKEGAPQ